MLGRDGTVTGNRNRAGPFLVRGARQLAKSKSRMDLFASSRQLRLKAFPAKPSTPTCRIQCARKKPRLVAIVMSPKRTITNAWLAQVLFAGHKLCQLHGPLCLRRG